MPTIDKRGALHDALGQYTFKPGSFDLYDLDSPAVTQDDIEYFSSGNCAIFADELHTQLAERLKDVPGFDAAQDLELVVIGQNPDMEECNWEHAMVRYQDKFMDVSGVYSETEALEKWTDEINEIRPFPLTYPLAIHNRDAYEEILEEWDDGWIDTTNGRMDGLEAENRAKTTAKQVIDIHLDKLLKPKTVYATDRKSNGWDLRASEISGATTGGWNGKRFPWHQRLPR